jgi:hypothetical protein
LRRFQESALQRIDVRRVLDSPFDRLGQPRAAVEAARIAPQRVPFLRRLGEAAVQAQPLAVFLQPAAQRRPLADERFVGHLGGVLVGGHQAGVGQGAEYLVYRFPLFGAGRQFVNGDPPAGVGLGIVPAYAVRRRKIWRAIWRWSRSS